MASFKNGLLGSLFSKPKSYAVGTGTVDLSIIPSLATVSVGDTFAVGISADAKTEQLSGVEVALSYDPQYLQATSVKGGSFLPLVLMPGSVASAGLASITTGASVGNYPSGQGVVASVIFKALKNTTTATRLKLDNSLAIQD